MEKGNEKIYYKDTFNLLYLHRFIKSRFINNKKRNGRMTNTEWFDENVEDETYDSELDNEIMIAYDKVMQEVDKLKDTKLWADALIFKLYFESDESLNELSKKLNVSKSTVFLSVKRIKTYIKELVDSPFKNEQYEKNMAQNKRICDWNDKQWNSIPFRINWNHIGISNNRIWILDDWISLETIDEFILNKNNKLCLKIEEGK